MAEDATQSGEVVTGYSSAVHTQDLVAYALLVIIQDCHLIVKILICMSHSPKSLARRKSDGNGSSFYKTTFTNGPKFAMGLTFDDVLLVPQYSEIDSRNQCLINTLFSKKIPLNLPIVSSPMDTVTQADMAIGMAKEGGLGIIHRFFSIHEQVKEIAKVKKSGAFITSDPVTVGPTTTYRQLKQLMDEFSVRTFLVVEDFDPEEEYPNKNFKNKKLTGIITNRDINTFRYEDEQVKQVMTPIDRIVSYQLPQNYQQGNFKLDNIVSSCKALAIKNKIEKIPLVDSKFRLHGLISLKDIMRYEALTRANKDANGRLYVGAAVGGNKDYIERTEALIKAGCDVLVVDVANGHNKLTMNAVEHLKDKFPTIDLVAGSVATGEGAEQLIRAGADGVRCGIGNGSICITRIVAGSGVPQLSALIDTVPICKEYEVPLISDGGNKHSGNMCKALAIGADSIMVGRLVAGCDQSPGKPLLKDGKFVKMFRGMAGLMANISKQHRGGKEEINPQTFSAEGVEGYIPYMGPLEYVLKGFANGIRSGMSYSGAYNLKDLKRKAVFIQMTASGMKESAVHDIHQI